MKLFKKNKNYFPFNLPINFWVIFLSSIISLVACVVFFNLNLPLNNFDAVTRLNIARKVTDNLTPGLGQFGSVWPFLPQLIMVPLAAITPLWRTGIAGTIMSAPAFIISAYFMYLIIFEITKSKFVSFIGFLIFATNINLLLLQTMAMSESLFICLTLGATYFLLQWVKNPTKSLLHLAFAGVFLSGASLTRYEGFSFTFAAIAVVFIIMLLKKFSFKTAEGITVLFGTMAVFGIALWCLYNATIFGDPLYWIKIYSGQSNIISTDVSGQLPVTAVVNVAQKSFLTKSADYVTSIAYMAGIPIFIIGAIGFIVYLFSFRPFKNQRTLIVLLPMSIVLFMLLTLYKGDIAVTIPQFNLNSLTHFQTTYAEEINIRYGLLLWPFIVIMVAWLFGKNIFLRIVLIVLLIVHLATPLYHKAFLIYQLPLSWSGGTLIHNPETQATNWFKANYTGGQILVSTLIRDAIMFQFNVPYKSFIHEGTGKYWTTSRDHPEIYAEWIFMSNPKDIRGGLYGEVDQVTKYLQYDPTLNAYFEKRYSDGIIDIYQRKDKSPNSSGEGFALIKNTTQANNSQGKFTGKIIDQKGNPISGVVLSTGNAIALSSSNGDFTLNVNKTRTTINVKKPGFETLTLNLDFSEMSLDGHKITMTPPQKESIFQKILSYL